MSIETEKYRSAALMKFSLLKPIYGRNGNFWRLGNSFDTIIDFFDFVDSTDAGVFAEYALDRYDKTKGDWFDDFGWWGIAGLKASQRPRLFPGFIDRGRVHPERQKSEAREEGGDTGQVSGRGFKACFRQSTRVHPRAIRCSCGLKRRL